jgi:Domain of unknown function (DUF1918)
MPARKTASRKASAKKATAKAKAKKAKAKKATAKKTTAKKATAKKATAKKATAETSKKPGGKKAAARTSTGSGETMRARRGDILVIPSQRVGSPPREGEILRVIQGEVSVSYEVRWPDGHQSLLLPGAGAFTTVRPERRT